MQRRTRQREAIKRAFRDSGRPLSPNEVLDKAQDEVPQLGIATVYRAISDLVEDQWLIPIDIPGQGIRYELAGLPHHHHFHCRRCHRVFDFDGCPGKIDELAPRDYLVEAHELTLIGLCPQCLAAGKKRHEPAEAKR